MGNRLATIHMGRKVGAAVPLYVGAGSPSNTMSPGRGLSPYQVVSWSIQPFGHNRHGPKSGDGAAVSLSVGEGELGPHLTQCGLGRGLPPYQVASWCIQPFGHNTPTLQTDRQTAQTGQTTVLWHRANRFTNGRPKTDEKIYTQWTIKTWQFIFDYNFG